MAKHIVVCSDGTGNTAVKGRGTNVFKLFEAIDLNGHRADPMLTPQIALYDDGVGTEDFKPLRLFSGMTGFGLSRNVKQLYKEIVRVYDAGDSIYLFGFSRGAFTVRTLAGFISTCGLLDPSKFRTAASLNAAVARAYRAYRQAYRTRLAEMFLGKPEAKDCAAFKKRWCRDTEVRIRFIGVWDTVDAVGLPFHLSDVLNTLVYRFKFPDRRLSPLVDRACHALAIDDARHSFHPLLWDETGETTGRISQVWFPGAHSNVGGGYPKQGMSLVALDWMMAESERAGLRFNEHDRAQYREHANTDDKLYDPRAGLGIFYRWKLRDIGAICRKNRVEPKLHISALERVTHGTEDYAPGNLPARARLVFTPPRDPRHQALLEERAKNMEAVLRRGPESLLAGMSKPVLAGQLSYYVYLVSCTVVLIAAVSGHDWSSVLNPIPLNQVGALTLGFISSPVMTSMDVARMLGLARGLLGCLIGAFSVAYALALWSHASLSRTFSQHWHDAQPQLREALKKARRTRVEAESSASGIRLITGTDLARPGGEASPAPAWTPSASP
jgi:uncharacterized protein (DUF2235 family)